MSTEKIGPARLKQLSCDWCDRHGVTTRELADIAGVRKDVMDFRIRKNWPMAEVVDRQKVGREQSYENKLRATSLLWKRRRDVAA